MFNFTPLLGAHSSSPASQSLLEFEGGIKVLIDVGWDAAFSTLQLKALEEHIPTLSIVLLTHATTSHLGAFAHACKHFPQFRKIPIYATTPVISLGQTLLQDLYSSTPAAASVIPSDTLGDVSYGLTPTTPTTPTDGPQILRQAPTADETRSYFALINDLKYSQPHQPLPSPFSPPLNGLTITAYNAGHTLGGTIWHIQYGMESVVYAVDWNQNKDNVLSGAAWLGGAAGGAEVIEQLKKPTALICSAKGVEKPVVAGGKNRRDESMLDMMRSTVGKGGTVLIPTDSSARVLEIAYMLEHAWLKDGNDGTLRKAKVYLAGKSAGTMMRYARSMLEWMDESVVREFESRSLNGGGQQAHRSTNSKRNNNDTSQPAEQGPFDFRFVRLAETKKKLEKVLGGSGPRIILASDSSMQWGFSKDVLERIGGDSNSCVVLTDDYCLRDTTINGESAGLGQTLYSWFQERRDGVAVEKGANGQSVEQVYTGGRELTIRTAEKVPLEGSELAVYQSYLATQRQLQTTMQTNGANALEASADAVDEASSDSSSSTEESDTEQQGKALNFSTTIAQANKGKGAGAKEAVGVNALLSAPGVYDWDVRGRKGREAMIPYNPKRRRQDDFGDIIRPEDYLRAEERDEIDGHDMRDGAGKDSGLGLKRKWDDGATANGTGRRGSMQKNKRARTGKQADAALPTPAASTNGQGSSELGSSSDEEDEYDPEDAASDATANASAPSKLVYRTRSMTANLRLAFIDFSGMHDSRSLTMLIPLIQPRKLVLVGGSASETSFLAAEMARKLDMQLPAVEGNAAADILMPALGEMVAASMDTNAWTVRLSRALTRRLHWQNVRGLGVVTLTARLSASPGPHTAAAAPDGPADDAAQRRKRQKLSNSTAAAAQADADASTTADTVDAAATLPPLLDVVPAATAAATRTAAPPLHVGDLRLQDLRKLLNGGGHAAEFRGEGTLVVDGAVAVRKRAAGSIEVEGVESHAPQPLGARAGRELSHGSFCAVRRRIYDGLAVIAGG